jgi:hypothetical protein
VILKRAIFFVIVVALLAGCWFQNRNEREADRITRAVIGNDLKPVQDDIAKGVTVTRVKVAEWSDELSAQGKLISVKRRLRTAIPAGTAST